MSTELSLQRKKKWVPSLCMDLENLVDLGRYRYSLGSRRQVSINVLGAQDNAARL